MHNQITSTPISAAKRLQFSMEVEPVPQFPLMAKMPQVLIPLMWVEESAHLNKTFTKPFSMLYT
jgi:scavenger receptor class B, member 1